MGFFGRLKAPQNDTFVSLGTVSIIGWVGGYHIVILRELATEGS
jgi:hypothetical protein